MEFTVSLTRFEGPYTKLLELISEHKLSITEISLASIADDYIAYVRSLKQDDSFDISQFIVVASTLMLIKAKSLLPGIVYTEEEGKQVSNLEKKLELFSILNNACGLIKSVYLQAPLYTRIHATQKGVTVFVPDSHLDRTTLQSVAVLTIASFKPSERLKQITVAQTLRMETVIENLLTRIQGAAQTTLSSLAGNTSGPQLTFAEKKQSLIVNFIALLELVRMGKLSVTQENAGEIYISSSA